MKFKVVVVNQMKLKKLKAVEAVHRIHLKILLLRIQVKTIEVTIKRKKNKKKKI